MKKFLTLIMAITLAMLPISIGALINCPTDLPDDIKDVIWYDAYKRQCRNYKKEQKCPFFERHNLLKRVLMLPLLPLLGVYEVSYTDAKGQRHSKEYDKFSEGRWALERIKKAGNKTGKIVEVKEAAPKDPEEAARASEAGLIRKVILLTGDVEYIPMPRCGLKRKLAALGVKPFDACIKIDASVSEFDDEAYSSVIGKMQRICKDAYVDPKGGCWIPLLASASDKRKGTFLAVRSDLYPKLGSWLMAGVPTKYIEMVISKYLVYMGLQTSSSKPMKEIFGKSFDFHRIAIIPDLNGETATPESVWFVNANCTVEERLNHKEPLNLFDGLGVYFVEAFPKKDRRLCKAFSGRFGVMTKFLAIPQSREEWREELDRRGLTGEFRQIDGTVTSIDKVDVILTESCFKGKALFRTVKAWQDACISNGYTMDICVQQHGKSLKDMPYQQGQLLKGTSADALALAQHAAASVRKWQKPAEAAKLIGGYLGAACELYPALLKTKYVQHVLQERYTARRDSMIAGKVPEVGYSVFVAPDPLAFFCHVFGQKLEFQIAEDEAIFSYAEDGQEGVLTRNPDTDGCPVVKFKKQGWGCISGVCYINPVSWVPILLRLDYDGDHILVIIEPLVVRMFKKTFELVDKRPIVWVAPSGKKERINKGTIAAALMASITGSQTGIHSDNLTKLWNISKADAERLIEAYGPDVITRLIAIETMNTNVDIDSTKNAGNTVKKTEEAKKLLKSLRALTLPDFCRFAKADEKWAADSQHWLDRCAYSGSLLDIYSRTVSKILPEHLELKGLDEEIFCVGDLMLDENRKTGDGYLGLAVKGERGGDDTYYNEGVFNNIAFRKTKEWRLVTNGSKNFIEWRDAVREASLREIAEYVSYQGGTPDGAYDIITNWFFAQTKGLSEKYYTTVGKAYVDTYAEKLYNVLALHFGAPDNDIPDEEDDEEAE